MELSKAAETIFLRHRELQARPKELERGREFTTKVRDTVEKWKKSKPQITEQEREDVLSKVDR
ncbi:unnamed protein product [Discosporangium mesarthrocarpum]